MQLADAINRALMFYEPGYRFTWMYKTGRWDGKTRLFDREHFSFPAGLADRVRAVLQQHDIEPEIVDERPDPPWGDTVPEIQNPAGITLYDDQREAVDALLQARRGCLSLPTNAGKTEIAASILIAARPAKALFIVDRKALMAQTCDRLETRLGERVGMLGGGFRSTRSRVTVATIQTLWHHLGEYRREFFSKLGVLIVDECHTISPKMWFTTLALIPATVRVGLSATIKEASRRLIVESYLGPIVYEEESRDLIDQGRSATPNVAMLQVGGMVDEFLDFAATYTKGIVQNQRRNEMIVTAACEARRLDHPTLILVVRIDHGRRLQALFEGQGISVPFLYGNTPLDDVQGTKTRLHDGRTPIVIASTIFDLGQDIPAVRRLILAGGQRSPLRTIQRVGRGLRRKDGDNRVDILDFYDVSCRLLRSQADERFRTYRRKKYEPRIISSLDEFTLEGNGAVSCV